VVPGDDVFDRFGPPFDLRADMLVTLVGLPTAPLRRAFPDVPFASVLGRTPALVWFSRVTSGCAHDAAGRRFCQGGGPRPLYNELTVLALRRDRALFCPAIWATSKRSVRIGRRYGMPKAGAAMGVAGSAGALVSVLRARGRRSWAWARALGGGRLTTAMLRAALPRAAWPVWFPHGPPLAAELEGLEHAWLCAATGRLDLPGGWASGVLQPLPAALAVRGLRFRMPPPAPPVAPAGGGR
jgi:hypothetical protein